MTLTSLELPLNLVSSCTCEVTIVLTYRCHILYVLYLYWTNIDPLPLPGRTYVQYSTGTGTLGCVVEVRTPQAKKVWLWRVYGTVRT